MNKQIQQSIDESVLCWLATSDKNGNPNVSPKEMFTYVEGAIVIANIASPKSIKNIKENSQVCVSFIDVFKQKGFKVKGKAQLISKEHKEFDTWSMKLKEMAGDDFPFATVIKVSVDKTEEIIAPRYRLFPDTTDKQQIESAIKTYRVVEYASQISNENSVNNYLLSAIKQFEYYKWLGEKTLEQISDDELLHRTMEDDNSIAMIINHISGNMLSRWTDFLTSDGEKPWRNREQEFEDVLKTRKHVQGAWDEGWKTLFSALATVNSETFTTMVYIRNMGHTVVEAVNRQLCHYAYHIGQIVLIGKQLRGEKWESLSIPKGQSNAYNKDKFKQEKRKSHFTDEFLNRKN